MVQANAGNQGLPPLPKKAEAKFQIPSQSLSFKGRDFIFYQKGSSWYTTVIIIGLVIIGISILMKQWPMTFAVTVAFGVMLMMANKKPNDIVCSFSDQGFKMQNKLYPWQKLKSYWIVSKPEMSTLYFSTTERFKPEIFVHIENSDFQKINQYLISVLPQEQNIQEESGNWISRIFKF
jgi:hypothetical protein